ncbi:porphobilinogen deaminase [Hanseniaspora valbyensis NRRL Y-1626]|uniref:Porphobilinogen deaminase n=1 Tax=Hanseniaspora valbyensis NRRL Y-1626 TaxID=766949 RepID=A0A1B7T9E5_9ASCO|nr:porphobilinogen deaminase [Hanseniaspora valbyensis NRRL Y-1626]
MIESHIIPSTLSVGGRSSALAVIQSEHIGSLILSKLPEVTNVPITKLKTLGDNVLNKPLYSFGGKALWTKELEDKLANRELDIVVHSLKDMPTTLPNGFILGAITKREDPSDCVVLKAGSEYKSLKELPEGSIIGTSSVRRSAQLRKLYPTLQFQSVRGNLLTRLRKLDDPESPFACIILATAGLVRQNLGHRISFTLQKDEMYHAVGQGALGLEIRKHDHVMQHVCNIISDHEATVCCLAERSLMRSLEGGCSVPIGVESHYNHETQELTVHGCVISVDGSKFVEASVTKKIEDVQMDANEVGILLSAELCKLGAKEILESIRFEDIH